MTNEVLSAGAAALRLGVAVTTLRTWHQRYGLGPSQHVPGHHRRYTGEDLARLEIMRRLTADGVSPAEAANWARRVPDPYAPAGPSDTEPAAPSRRRRMTSRTVSGAPTIPLGRAGPAARGLARAAMRLDQVGVRTAIERSIASGGVVHSWDRLLRPVLAGIGLRHAAGGGLIEVEHLLSRCASEALSSVPRPDAAGPPRILLSCGDEEQHTLPLEALSAALAEAGVPCRMLGARMPPAALVRAVTRTGPLAVVLWSHAPMTADPGQLDAVLASPHRPLLLLAAGPGWRPEALPPGVIRPVDLAQALSLTLAVRDSTDRPVTG